VIRGDSGKEREIGRGSVDCDRAAYRWPLLGSTVSVGKTLAREVPGGAVKTTLAVQLFPMSMLRETMM
jgi:hypothetical protein